MLMGSRYLSPWVPFGLKDFNCVSLHPSPKLPFPAGTGAGQVLLLCWVGADCTFFWRWMLKITAVIFYRGLERNAAKAWQSKKDK